MHPRLKHWHRIDYVISRRKDRQDVRVTKTMCGAYCWTDHRLVVSKLILRIQPVRRPQGKKVPKKLDASKMKQDSKRQAVINVLCSRLDALELLSSGKAPGSDAIPAEIYKAGDPPVAEQLTEFFTLYGEKKPSLKNSRMQQLSTYSKRKGIIKPVTIIEASLYCQLLGRSLLGSY